MINPAKPIRFTHKHERPITLVGVMPNGNLVVTSVYNDGKPWESPVVFDRENGNSVITGPGNGLVIENAPVVESGFWPLDKDGMYGRGLTVLSFVWSEHRTAKHALEIIRTDGVPTDARIHARPPAG